FFRQNLIDESKAQQDLKQVWFAGVHSDVGGSYPETESGLSKIALQWMAREAQQAGLLINREKMDVILGGDSQHTSPDPSAVMHRSLRTFWWLGEIYPKRVMQRI